MLAALFLRKGVCKIGRILDFPKASKEDEVKIRMDLTIDLPKEVADEAERLGICEFDRCSFDPERRCLTIEFSTTFYRKGA